MKRRDVLLGLACVVAGIETAQAESKLEKPYKPYQLFGPYHIQLPDPKYGTRVVVLKFITVSPRPDQDLVRVNEGKLHNQVLFAFADHQAGEFEGTAGFALAKKILREKVFALLNVEVAELDIYELSVLPTR